MKINPILIILLIFLVPISACISRPSPISNESVSEKDPILGTWISPLFNESEITFSEDGSFFVNNKFGCVIYPQDHQNQFICSESQISGNSWKGVKSFSKIERQYDFFGTKVEKETKMIDNWYRLDYQSTEFGTSPLCKDQSNCWLKRNSTLVLNYNSTDDRLTRYNNLSLQEPILSFQEPEMKKYYWVRVNSQK